MVVLVDNQQHKHRTRDTEQLNKFILIASVAALNLEAALNTMLLMFHAPVLVELLRMCTLIELQINVPTYKQREAVRTAWNIIAFQVTPLTPSGWPTPLLNMALDIYSEFGTLVLVEKGRKLEPFPMAVLVSYCCVGITFLAFHGLSIRVLLTYCSRSIVLYVNCIRTSLDRCLRSRGVPESSKVLLVDQVRAQLSLVKNLADMACSMLGPSLLYAYTYSVVLLCGYAYYATAAEFPFRVRLFFFFSFVLHWLSILVPPVEAHRMKIAVTELRSVVQCVPMADHSDDLLVQLRMMLYAIKPDDLKFTGCGFFAVDLSTFAGVNLRYKSVSKIHIKFSLVGMLRLSSELEDDFVMMDGDYMDGQATLTRLVMFCYTMGLHNADIRYFITGLGCVHDGEGPRSEIPGHAGSIKPECAAYLGYLMSYSGNNGKNHYHFSPCCQAQIKLFLRLVSDECIQKTFQVTQIIPGKGFLPGHWISPHRYCVMKQPKLKIASATTWCENGVCL
ncbi:hypothetical protein HPB49_024898 [Dermacentor silvarum]|uniref:Uncharacterized protein n=1 Tax=Dermacentor silvarum TaxID=543639 RepID=A0ACB8C662_DERSI|nr:hypothetical protein HPB49_024898 [Dermacentor silvarum]